MSWLGSLFENHIVSSDSKEVLYGASINTSSEPLTFVHKSMLHLQRVYT